MIDASYFLWLLTISIVAYIFISDKNVPAYFILLTKLFRINCIRFFIGLKLRTQLKYDKFILDRKLKKIKNK